MNHPLMSCFAVGVCAVLLAATGSPAATIAMNNYEIEAAADQEIFITVSGGDVVNELEFAAQLGENGDLATELEFQSVEIVADGFVFNSVNANPQVDLYSADPVPQTWWAVTDTKGGLPTALADGVLARLVIDASGASQGQVFPLLLEQVGQEALGFQVSTTLFLDGTPINLDIGPQTITIVPEPGTLGLLGVCLAGLALCRRRRP